MSHLYLVRRDGSRRHKLSAEPGAGCSWSPDGSTVVFAGGGDIRTIRADGAGLTRLTRTAAVEHDPAWSPDGSTIAFLRQARGGRSAPFDLWTMAADGSAQTRVASDVSSFVWSPDGTMVAFIKGSRGFVSRKKRDGLWVAQADGSGQVELARGADQVDWQRLP